MKLSIQFFKRKDIYWNDEVITLPYAKARLLLCLLVEASSLTRTLVCRLLWPESDEVQARKSLRNAIYEIRKRTAQPLILSEGKEIITLNPLVRMESDLIEIKETTVWNDDSIRDFSENMGNDFLSWEDFSFSWELEEWADEKVLYYRKKMMEKTVELMSASNQTDVKKKLAQLLISLDPYHEAGYQTLMEMLLNEGDQRTAIQVYKNYAKMLKEEFDVEPHDSLKLLYDRSIHPSKAVTNRVNTYFERQHELIDTECELQRWSEGSTYRSVYIFGESGIGKTRYLREVEKNMHMQGIAYSIACFKHEKSFPFFHLQLFLKEMISKVAKDKLEQINSTYPELIQQIQYNDVEYFNFSKERIVADVMGLLRIITGDQGAVLLIDDLQYLDAQTSEILVYLLSYSKRLMFIMTSSYRLAGNQQPLLSALDRYQALFPISLNRLEASQLDSFLDCLKGKLDVEKEQIMEITEGSPFFIVEMLNNQKYGNRVDALSHNMKNLMESYFERISSQAREVMNLCSCMNPPYRFEDIQSVLSMDLEEAIGVVQELIDNGAFDSFVCMDGSPCFKFSHNKLKDYTSEKLSGLVKQTYHCRLFRSFAEKKKGKHLYDHKFMSDIIHHCKGCGDKLHQFKYEIMQMESISNISHEVFPTCYTKRQEAFSGYFLDEDAFFEKTTKLIELYEEIEDLENVDLIHYYCRLLIMIGRFKKDRIDEDSVHGYFDKCILIAKRYQFKRLLYISYVMKIHHAINVDDMEELKEQLDCIKYELLDTLEETDQLNYKKFEGYYQIRTHQREKGKQILCDVLKTYHERDVKGEYRLSRASALYFLAEGERCQKNYESSIDYLLQAADLVEKDKEIPSMAIILSRLGISTYELGRYSEAHYYLNKSIQMYDRTIFEWGKKETLKYLEETKKKI